jgi:hypothetical protein
MAPNELIQSPQSFQRTPRPQPHLFDRAPSSRHPQNRKKLISDRRSQGGIRHLETLCGDHLCRDLVRGDQTRRVTENVHTEPRRLVTRKVAGPPIGALRLDLGLAGTAAARHRYA